MSRAVLARPPTVLPRVEVTTLAAPVTPELLSFLSFMLGWVDLVETIKGTNGYLAWLL